MATAHTDAPKIEISVTQTDKFMEFSVHDNGPGLEFDKPIYTPFQSGKAEGMGMGLSICRSIVEGHGGVVSLDQTAPVGARFLFTLPRARGLS